MSCPRSFCMKGKSMTEKELLNQLKQMNRDKALYLAINHDIIRNAIRKRNKLKAVYTLLELSHFFVTLSSIIFQRVQFIPSKNLIDTFFIENNRMLLPVEITTNTDGIYHKVAMFFLCFFVMDCTEYLTLIQYETVPYFHADLPQHRGIIRYPYIKTKDYLKVWMCDVITEIYVLNEFHFLYCILRIDTETEYPIEIRFTFIEHIMIHLLHRAWSPVFKNQYRHSNSILCLIDIFNSFTHCVSESLHIYKGIFFYLIEVMI